MDNKQPVFDFLMGIFSIGYWCYEKAREFVYTETFDAIVGALAVIGLILLFDQVFC